MTYSPKAFEIAVLGTSQIGKFISTHGTTGDVIIPDDDKFSFGTGSDASIYFDATNLVIADEDIPVQIGNSSNTVTIAGNLTVNGTTTTINSTIMTVDDVNLVLASGAADSSAANGAGITIDGASATLLYTHATTSWDMNKPLNVTGAGTFSGILKTDDTTDATSKTDGSLQTDGGLSVAKKIYNGTAATFAADSGIVTIGSSTAATFSAAGLLNINNATDATSTTDGSLQTDGGLSVAKDCIFGNDVKLLTDASVFAMGVDSDFTITHDNSTGAAIAAGATGLAINTDTVTFGSANASDPLVIIQNTTNDTSAARLRFVKDKGAAGADGDDIGIIEFYGDDSAQTQTAFAKIVAEVSESLDGDEAGKLSFYVAESDSTNTALAAGLVLEGEHATDGEVDVTIGAGTASTTTIAGDLKVTTDIILDDGGSLKEAGGVAAITFDGSANVTKIGLDTPSDGQVLTWTTSGTARAVWSPVTATTATTATNVVITDNESTDEDNAITFVAGADIDGSTSAGLESDGDLLYNPSKGRITATDMAVNGVFVNSCDVGVVAAGTISKGFTGITTASTNRQMDLPEASATNIGAMYTIKKLDSGTGQVKITRDTSADTIDGGTGPIILYHQNESVTLIVGADTKWFIM